MFKKRKVNNMRVKPSTLPSEESSDEEISVQKMTMTNLHKKLKSGFTTSTAKPKRTNEETEGNIMAVTFNSSGTSDSLSKDSATRTLDVDGIVGGKEGDIIVPDDPDDESYRGIEGYKEYINKKTSNVNQMSASRIRAGPLKGVTNVRISCRYDYAPDVCKDYKETGYCGYGDSCKFMHDRGDYKSGWEIDREYDIKQSQMAAGMILDDGYEEKWLVNSDEDDEKGEDDEDTDSEDDGLPFACYLCRQGFTNPVMTKCQHYFCEKCAIKHYAKSPKCFACGLPTNGVFNVAKDLLSKMAKREERRTIKEKEIREAIGHGGYEDDENDSGED